jgi:hypothetical protein
MYLDFSSATYSGVFPSWVDLTMVGFTLGSLSAVRLGIVLLLSLWVTGLDTLGLSVFPLNLFLGPEAP